MKFKVGYFSFGSGKFGIKVLKKHGSAPIYEISHGVQLKGSTKDILLNADENNLLVGLEGLPFDGSKQTSFECLRRLIHPSHKSQNAIAKELYEGTIELIDHTKEYKKKLTRQEIEKYFQKKKS